ncbi:hypothetical protein SLNWT_1362 [Streptomyces albus]|uniref:Uncharacterized protein n=1 Tax=Streptomyces albus (strain ATCC 21838 / DSM 41398 / FERM P-419 / JCM 4703 / NBRC 107858) TaxID=1081613 RepID=A0A0B5EHR6_STRA4|nr:hypothetical protein SLNWT_1362 [Streptomyces albus]AOU76054.1 hypothetical protein SLNHY_1363 [Streptomyces albus]AYN31853.1 hypothetical protein DUI70_1350 [Streptomyces albus]
MPTPAADLHLRLDLLNGRPSAVTATLTGTPTHTVRALLALHGFEPLDDTTMVMAHRPRGALLRRSGRARPARRGRHRGHHAPAP